MAVIYHPGTEGVVEVPDDSVWHYRAGGWLLKSEWDEHQALEAQRAADKAEAEKAQKSSAAAGKPAGGDAKKE